MNKQVITRLYNGFSMVKADMEENEGFLAEIEMNKEQVDALYELVKQAYENLEK